MFEKRKAGVILVADDDTDDWALLKEAFRESDSPPELRFVEDGVELIDYLKGNGRYADQTKFPRPVLILLDLNMPRMDGREALAEIKGDPLLKIHPVVIFTTSSEPHDVGRTYRNGANSYVRKPATFSELRDFTSHLERYWFEVVKLPLAV